MLFLSTRNSDEAQESVITQASCDIFLSSQSMEEKVRKLLKSRPSLSKIAHYVVPEQNDLLKNEFIPEFSYNRTVEEARYDPLVILHTSRLVQFSRSLLLPNTHRDFQHNGNSEDDSTEPRLWFP